MTERAGVYSVPGIYLSCLSNLGQGGLGKHLEFVYRTAMISGKPVNVFCHGAPSTARFSQVEESSWNRLAPYTPVRWMPSMQVYWNGIEFDKKVRTLLPENSVVYHSFPGCAEYSFEKVRKYGGIAVLEAATTHVLDLYSAVSSEHKNYKISGAPFSIRWVNKVLREYELADYISVASHLQWESFIKHGIPETKLLMAHLGIDTEVFSPREDQASLKTRENNEKFRIIQLGQVSLLKGFQYLLEALDNLKDPDIELVLYGGIGWRSIKKLINSYMTKGVNIRFGAGNPIPALQDSHICVHSSISDGFGYAPLEAMAVGLPTIVTDATGMKDVIRGGENGFIVPAKDSAALASYILELKSNENDRLRIGRAAREAALKYDITPCTNNYAKLLRPIWKHSG